MQKWIPFKQRLALLVVLVLIFVTGCQTVSGVDLNRILTNQYSVDAMEGTMTINIDLEFDDAYVFSEEEERMLQLLNGISLVLENVKQEGPQHGSVKGKLVTGRGDIPFAATIDGQRIVLAVDGLDRPLVIDGGASALDQYGYGAYDASEQAFEELAGNKQLIESVQSFLFKHLTNPRNLTVRSTSDTINGQAMALYHIHTELDGVEMLDIFRKLIVGILKDDQGLKEVIGVLYDAIFPLIEEDFAEELGFYLDESFTNIMYNRELAVEFLHAVVKGGLVYAASSINADDPSIAPIAEGLSVSADLYVDGHLHVRKADIQLRVAPELPEDGLYGTPLTAFTVSLSGEYWNHNGPVQADTIDTDSVEPIFVGGYYDDDVDFVRLLDKESLLYDLLMNDFGLGRKFVSFSLYEPEEDEFYYYYYYVPEEQKPLSDNGVMIVPARYLADSLGLDLSWNGVKRELVLYDYHTDTTIVVTQGSADVIVNGELQVMPVPVSIHYGQSYVPLRFIADAIGAELVWDPDTMTVYVTKN